MSEHASEQPDAPRPVRLLFDREEMVDRFDAATYFDDLESILRERRADYGDAEVARWFAANGSIDHPAFRPIRAPAETDSLFGYDATQAWEGSKDARAGDAAAVDKILRLQGEYSYLGGRRGEDRTFFALHRPETGDPWTARLQTATRFDILRPEEPCLCIGPRWAGEVRYFREVIGLKGTIGLDLYTFDEGFIQIGDMHQMPFPDNRFGLVYQRNTFNKSYDIRRAVHECVRVLRPGGLLVSDDCLGYTHGVSPLARTNMRHNRWMVNFLTRNCPTAGRVEVLYDVETPSEADWHARVGQLMVRVGKRP